jgi:uncharacterized membrane protein
MYCINTFLFYSIIGHFIENIFYTKIDSGILYGYWSCVYGIGALIILVINYFICKKYKNKLFRPIMLFIFSFFILGFFELVSGYILEETFGRVFWNYSDDLFSIFKYTSLKMMFIWGFSSVLFIYVIHPYMNLIIKKIPKSISLTLAFLFLFDLIYTLITIGN